MGNRAVLEFKDGTGIYLHWNGGPESVLAFLDAAKEGVKANRARVDEDDAKGVSELRSKGMTVIENVDKSKFVTMLAPVNADFEKQFGKANIDNIRAVK